MKDISVIDAIGASIVAAICVGFFIVCVLCNIAERLMAMRKRDKYLLAAIFNLVWYCVAVLVLTAYDHAVPDSLTVAWFAAWSTELALLANIKIKSKGDD